MTDLIILAVLAVIVGFAVRYVYKAKKSGAKCIGCHVEGGCAGSCGAGAACSCGSAADECSCRGQSGRTGPDSD